MDFNPENYVRLFEFRNYPLFYDSLWMEFWKENRCLCVNVDGLRTSYIPKDIFVDTLKKGKELYGNTEKLNEYIKEFKNAEETLIEVTKALAKNSSLLPNLKEAAKKWFDYYGYTDFHCTDNAQEEIERNFPSFGKFKDYKREIINKVAVGEESYLMQFVKNLSNEKEIKIEYLLLHTVDELIEHKKLNVEERKNHVMYHENGKLNIISGKEAINIANKFRKKTIGIGKIANKGRVRGRAFVFHNDISYTSQLSSLIKNMQKGDIFITETTSPELILFCRKAGAIITNQGGIMSHAAIVSRELEIPCIVGVENATHFFKTGDLIEVDADNGSVRKIEKTE